MYIDNFDDFNDLYEEEPDDEEDYDPEVYEYWDREHADPGQDGAM